MATTPTPTTTRRRAPRGNQNMAVVVGVAVGGRPRDPRHRRIQQLRRQRQEAGRGYDRRSRRSACDLLGKALGEIQAGNLDQAKSDLEQAAALDPQNKYAFYNLGYIAQTQGDKGDAEKQYKLAIAIDPKFDSALYNLAIIRVGDNDITGAIALYRQAVAANPSDANAHFNLGLLLRQTGNTAEGNAQVQTAVQLVAVLKEAASAQGVPTRGALTATRQLAADRVRGDLHRMTRAERERIQRRGRHGADRDPAVAARVGRLHRHMTAVGAVVRGDQRAAAEQPPARARCGRRRGRAVDRVAARARCRARHGLRADRSAEPSLPFLPGGPGGPCGPVAPVAPSTPGRAGRTGRAPLALRTRRAALAVDDDGARAAAAATTDPGGPGGPGGPCLPAARPSVPRDLAGSRDRAHPRRRQRPCPSR